jgi:uncharacterized protein
MVQELITRRESEEINANPGWSLIFGRRKVGKTFMIEHFVKFDIYTYVRIDRSVAVKGLPINEFTDLADFKKAVMDALMQKKTVVIDEFQRLPAKILEDIAAVHPSGRLMLCGSSMRVSNEMLGRNSPLLGLLRPFKIGLISPRDLLTSLSHDMSVEKAVEFGPLLRDPWTLPFFKEKDFLKNVVAMSPYTVPGLLGEIFTEDERELTQTYASILSLIGSGYQDYRDIANILHTRGIIKTSSSSSVLPYIKNMMDMGLLEPVKIFGKNRYAYSILSFPIKLYYFLQSRYAISDRSFSYNEIEPAAINQLHLGIEEFVGDLFAETLDGKKEVLKDDSREIDILITSRNRPILVGEVKWGQVTKRDITQFLGKVQDIPCRKVIVTNCRIKSEMIEIVGPEDLIGMAKKKK